MELEPIVEVLRGRSWVALTGAGCSTESGIPDYRSPGRPPRNPIQGPQFKRDPLIRARYWARSMVGWPAFAAARPNATHAALAALERAGVCTWMITQNVDRLHHAAGSQRVTELHGALAVVVCLDCGARGSRQALQSRLEALNPHAVLPAEDPGDAELAPDGDAERAAVEGFVVPACVDCGGVLKPDVVFFGENVPAARVEEAYAAVDAADALVVAGSSLQVWSGFRFVRRAVAANKPVVLLNRGPTRADDLTPYKLEGPLGEVLPALAGGLGVR